MGSGLSVSAGAESAERDGAAGAGTIEDGAFGAAWGSGPGASVGGAVAAERAISDEAEARSESAGALVVSTLVPWLAAGSARVVAGSSAHGSRTRLSVLGVGPPTSAAFDFGEGVDVALTLSPAGVLGPAISAPFDFEEGIDVGFTLSPGGVLGPAISAPFDFGEGIDVGFTLSPGVVAPGSWSPFNFEPDVSVGVGLSASLGGLAPGASTACGAEGGACFACTLLGFSFSSRTCC